MIAGGAGITPILGMTIEALETEPDSRITLLYASRTLASTMFLDELEDLKDRYPARLDVIHVLSGAGQSETDLLQGRLDAEKLKAIAARRIAIHSVDRAYLCGPGSFIKEARNALFDLGLARDRVHHEFFAGRTGGAVVAAPAQPVPAAPPMPDTASTPAVAIIDGQRHDFPIASGQSVLAAALAAGLKAPYSCTGGMCSTCRARIVEGSATMTLNYSLEPWEIERGFTLTCQAVPTSPKLVIDYDAM
jgi:ring-1,2-phenylacetyl-CoA epoxidase subunit PaaE